MSLKNKPKGKKIIPIVAGILAISAVGLAALVSGPTIAEQIADRKFNEDKNTALYNYSRESYLSGQNVKISDLKFSSEEDLYNFVRAYSQEYSSK